MTPSELLAVFRDEMSDTKVPYLWSDDSVIGFLDDAQKQFTRLTDGIPDSTTTAVVDLIIAPTYTDVLSLHPSILKIRSAYRVGEGTSVEVVNLEDMEPRGMRFDGRVGRVRAIVTGMDPDKVRLWPFPNQNDTVRLSVFRRPLTTITDNEALEIPSDHHLGLLKWMKHRAYSVHDAETYDKTKAEDFEQEFYAYCTRAKVEQARARHKPRSVAYGGL
jgi:hypothetical protein